MFTSDCISVFTIFIETKDLIESRNKLNLLLKSDPMNKKTDPETLIPQIRVQSALVILQAKKIDMINTSSVSCNKSCKYSRLFY